MIAQIFPTWWVYQHLPIVLFIFAFGACVGSFINVVIYRLPRGMSLTTPPSRCPTCGAKLKFFSENLPILGWFLLRGKCRYCRAPISAQYMIVEVFMAVLFTALYVTFYMVHPDTPWWGSVGSEWWYSFHGVGFFRTWPAFIALAFLLAGLVAMTVIDARTFLIPIQIPVFITITAFIAYPLQSLLPLHRRDPSLWPMPATDWQWFAIALGGMIGIMIGVILLRLGKLSYSFADYEQYVEQDQVLGDYPHARREMWVEVTFLLPCILGIMLGWFAGFSLPAEPPPVFVQALGGSMMGYIVGGGLIWSVRILGTLAFGREAMGLGDVHLLAAIGAVLGAVDPIWIFFIAPFSGLIWHFASAGASSIFRSARPELPYGPHLAFAMFVLIALRPMFNDLQATFLPFVSLPGLH